jgi:phosphoribosyl 1,2-cyclic phosphodiesterase
VTHRGPTLGYRVEADGTSLCYIPDHEPGLGAPLDGLEDDWISGFDLARGASLLLHDGQYTDDEYPAHLGWGHSPLSDALTFAHRTGVERLLLFHHDPLHTDDFLDVICDQAEARWKELGRHADTVELATERHEVVLPALSGARSTP